MKYPEAGAKVDKFFDYEYLTEVEQPEQLRFTKIYLI